MSTFPIFPNYIFSKILVNVINSIYRYNKLLHYHINNNEIINFSLVSKSWFEMVSSNIKVNSKNYKILHGLIGDQDQKKYKLISSKKSVLVVDSLEEFNELLGNKSFNSENYRRVYFSNDLSYEPDELLESILKESYPSNFRISFYSSINLIKPFDISKCNNRYVREIIKNYLIMGDNSMFSMFGDNSLTEFLHQNEIFNLDLSVYNQFNLLNRANEKNIHKLFELNTKNAKYYPGKKLDSYHFSITLKNGYKILEPEIKKLLSIEYGDSFYFDSSSITNLKKFNYCYSFFELIKSVKKQTADESEALELIFNKLSNLNSIKSFKTTHICIKQPCHCHELQKYFVRATQSILFTSKSLRTFSLTFEFDNSFIKPIQENQLLTNLSLYNVDLEFVINNILIKNKSIRNLCLVYSKNDYKYIQKGLELLETKNPNSVQLLSLSLEFRDDKKDIFDKKTIKSITKKPYNVKIINIKSLKKRNKHFNNYQIFKNNTIFNIMFSQ